MSNEELLQMIEDYNNYISNVPEGCVQLSELIKEGNIESTTNQILNFSEGVGWMIFANRIFSENSIVTGLEQKSLEIILEEINDALEKKDYYLVADIFEYGIKEYFENLEEVKFGN